MDAFHSHFITKSKWRKLLSLAQGGDAEAQWEIGYCHEFGAVNKSGTVLAGVDPLEARRWYEHSAKQGYSAAQCAGAALKPYRVSGNTAHFQVSNADFDAFGQQIDDAICFLQTHEADVQLMLCASQATAVLDFAIEWRDVAVQCDSIPAELVRVAGSLGLALEISHYPVVSTCPDPTAPI